MKKNKEFLVIKNLNKEENQLVEFLHKDYTKTCQILRQKIKIDIKTTRKALKI